MRGGKGKELSIIIVWAARLNHWCMSFMSLQLHTAWKIRPAARLFGIRSVIFNDVPLRDPIPLIKNAPTSS